MIAFIKGIVYSIGIDHVIVDVNGIGYHVGFNKPESLVLNASVFLHTSLIVKEDSQTLYGFLDIEEKRMFEQLINVKGIGPKTALAALSVSSLSQLTKAIMSEDVDYLKTLPQIGAKSASQIILDLKGKLAKNNSNEASSPKISDTISALKQLGYKSSELSGLANYLASLVDLDDQEMIKEGLKWLLSHKKGF